MEINILILLALFSLNYSESEFGKLIFEENFDTEYLNLSIWEYDLGNGIMVGEIMNYNFIEKILKIYIFKIINYILRLKLKNMLQTNIHQQD